jgi:hypothetical protein
LWPDGLSCGKIGVRNGDVAGKVLMGQNDDHVEKEDGDPSRTLDVGKPLYEIGSRIGGYKLLWGAQS